MSDTKYGYYASTVGYKIIGKTNADVVLAGGGTTSLANYVDIPSEQAITGLKKFKRGFSVNGGWGNSKLKTDYTFILETTSGAAPATAKGVSIGYHLENHSNVQAGIYFKADDTAGTAMAFATTNSYAIGPQIAFTINGTGVVNFERALPTYQGAGLATQAWVDGSFAYRNGTNAIDTWNRDSQGLLINGTVEGKTFGPGGVGASLNDATHGTVAGVINNYGTASGNPTNHWYHRIKMLHNNAAGYYTEIAVAMDAVPAMYYKQLYHGATVGWIEVMDVYKTQLIGGVKCFRTTGNSAVTDIPLQAYSDNASFPAISFHKAGAYAGSIALYSNQFQFRNLPGTGFLNAKANQFASDYGFVHEGYYDPNAVLTSDGGVAYAEVDIINDGGELRINPYEHRANNGAFIGSAHKHKLVYVISEGQPADLYELERGQRLVIFNQNDANTIDVILNGIHAGKLDPLTKISLYIDDNTKAVFYDQTQLFIDQF